MSALLAPIMMMVHSGHVLHILLGFDTGWEPQRRDDGSVPFKSIIRRHRDHVVLGVISLIAALLISPSLAAWMSPTIAGLILAIPLSWGTGLKSVGMVFRRARPAGHARGKRAAADRDTAPRSFRGARVGRLRQWRTDCACFTRTRNSATSTRRSCRRRSIIRAATSPPSARWRSPSSARRARSRRPPRGSSARSARR